MKLYSVNGSRVEVGAPVETYTLKSNDSKIPVLRVGEDGRGRKEEMLPLELLPSSYKAWKEGKEVIISFVELTTTKAGKPKLREVATSETTDKCVVVFNTQIGYRGGNSHTGDRCQTQTSEDNLTFEKFPALETLAEGIIAQGTAGNMGSGAQLIAVMPANIVFRTGYSGRLYGEPAAHYYRFDGAKLQVATWEDRELTDCF